MSEGGSTLASRRKYKKKKKPEENVTKMTAASLRGRKDGIRAHDAQMVSAAQLIAANGGPVEAGELQLINTNDEDDEENSTDIDIQQLSGAMLKAHRKELANRKSKVWKKKRKKKRNPNPDLCFDPFELSRSDSFSECRLCLEPGALRGCCGGYYCNKCFYKTDFCPGCDTSVKSLVTVTNDSADPTKNTYGFMEVVPLLRGCLAKIGVYAVVLGVPFSIFYGFITIPPDTVHGYKCSGFMPICEIELCSNFFSHINGLGTKYYDPTGNCNNGHDGHCVCSLGCVYDQYLYTRTNGFLGLDYCENSLNTWSIVMQDHFDDGVWNPKGWSEIKNGQPSTLCSSDSANASLLFQGEVVYRSATTVGLDVSYGAKVEFRLRYGNEKGCVDCCQDLYSPGTVTLSLSNNDKPFEPYMTYGIHDYKTNGFSLVSETIPSDRLSTNTKFKWHQDRFARYRDSWAIDNVTILAQALPSDWRNTDEWKEQKKKIRSNIEKYACCFGSDLCDTNTAVIGYQVEKETIEECIERIENYPSTVTIKSSKVITIGNVSTGVTTIEKISYQNHSAQIIVDDPSKWLKSIQYNGGSYDIRYERADDATYALVGCMLLYMIRLIFLNGQRRCPCCNSCKKYMCPDKNIVKARREKKREKKRHKLKSENEKGKGKRKNNKGINTSTNNSTNGIEMTDIAVSTTSFNPKKNSIVPNNGVVVEVGTTKNNVAKDDEQEKKMDDKEIVTTEIVEFPAIVSKKFLFFFLIMTWVPLLGGVIYVGMFIVPFSISEIRMLTIPNSFEWSTTESNEIMDYRNIHKGVLPFKSNNEEWERLWKYPSRFITTTIDIPFPRLFTILFAMVLDVVIGYKLLKQVRVDELLRPCESVLACMPCINIRPKFRLNLFHHSGEMMDVPNTLLQDHLIYDDLPLFGPDIEFHNRFRPARIGAIQLKRIKSVLGVSKNYAKWIAFGLIFSGIPWGCLIVLLPDSRGILSRLPSVICSCFFAMRCLGGHLVFIDSFFIFQAFTSFNAFRYWTLSTHLFKSLCMKGGLFCMSIGIVVGAVVLSIFNLMTSFGPEGNLSFVQLWLPWMVVSSGMFLLFGFIFGCRRSLPTRIIPILTSLGSEGKDGTLITFTQLERCTCCHQNMRELCIQEESLLVFMEDARELDTWLKCQYLMN